MFFQHENDQNSKYVHEMHQYWSVDDNFGVVRQLRMPAFQRRQARQNPFNRRSIRGHVLIQNPHFLSADAARMDIYFLNGHYQNQNEMVEFINYCKCSENSKGYLTQAFFKTITTKKAKFISGPFANMMFEILKKQKNKLKIIVGNVVTTISDNSGYLYRPV